MTHIQELATPCCLVDLDILERNLQDMAALCEEHGHSLCPMTKTHKSSALAQMQAEHGATALLVGTLDEAEVYLAKGHAVVLPYPIAGKENLARLAQLAASGKVTVSLDGKEAARELHDALVREGLGIDYLLIIDCGLHRFGVEPEQAPALAKELAPLSGLRLAGIGTHPGHVYGVSGPEQVESIARQELNALEQTKKNLEEAGFPVGIVATGSTPTVRYIAEHGKNMTLRPGNYVFNDAIQLSLNVASESQCSLTVLATVIANPRKDVFLIDAGSKCLGLDKGAHGNALLQGYGMIKEHPELTLVSLSEEVGKIQAEGSTSLAVGDTIEIIPNHACSAANMVSFLIGRRGDAVESVMAIDARGGSLLNHALRKAG